MIEQEAETFVERFAAARAARDGAQFLALWHPGGATSLSLRQSHREGGSEIGMLNDRQTAKAPHLTWTLVGWTWRENALVIEWESANRYGDRALRWRGVDKTLVDGRIVEEIVYADTAPLQALRPGRSFDALIQLPA